MRNTVDDPPLTERKSEELDVFALVNKLRAASNQTYRTNSKRITTAGTGVATTAWTATNFPQDGTWLIEAIIVGFATSGGTGSAVYDIMVGVTSNAGTLSIIGGTSATVMARETAAAMDGAFDLTANLLTVTVQDDGVLTMDWLVNINVVEVKSG